MSWQPSNDPVLGDPKTCDALDLIIVPRTRDLGDGFAVRRALPHGKRQMVGPFIFFDHFGPAEFRAGHGMDVRPHPHIGLATVTYLFEGTIMHRDSLGTVMAIKPGAVNWMTAGRGIAHSERTPSELRGGGEPIHGLQMWVALPAAKEEMAPAFMHNDASAFPEVSDNDKTIRVVAGGLYGARSPMQTTSDTMFADVTLEAGAKLPVDPGYAERAIYVVEGEIDIMGDRFTQHQLLVLKPGDAVTLSAVTPAHIMLLGGEPMDGPRHIWWNFVSSRRERIEEAKAQWKAGRFEPVPDETEFIPLPEQNAPPQIM